MGNRGWGIVFALAGWAQVGCAVEDPGGDLETRSQAVNARISYGSMCTPFAALHWHRGAFYARTVGASNAFLQCLQNSMQDAYTPAEIAAVLKMYADFNNHVVARCDPNDLGLSVSPLGTYGSYDEKVINVGIGGGMAAGLPVAPGGYHEAEPDWTDYSAAGNEFMPWVWRATDLLHEFAHAQGYPDGALIDIIDSCGAGVVTQSHRQCAMKATGNPACTRDQLYLLESWTGTNSTVQSSSTCKCTTDPLRLVSFRRTQSGTRLSAIDGGGREIRTNETTQLGPWQTFFVINNRRGALDPTNTDRADWFHMDAVQIKTFDGSWLSSIFDATADSPVTLQVGRPAVRRIMRNGDIVHLMSTDANGRRRFASDDGFKLSWTNLIPGPNEEFYVDIYRRDMMVYLRTAHGGRFIEARADHRLYNDVTGLDVYTSDSVARKQRAAFWLIDWNGGDLRDGDTVSFEEFQNERWHYWSTYGIGSGQLFTRHSVGADERFTIVKMDVTTGTVIGHDDRIALRASSGRFVTAWPAAGGFAIVNVGRAPGAWEQFTLRTVQEHDRRRPTW